MKDLTQLDHLRFHDLEARVGGNDEPAAQGYFRVHHRGRSFAVIASTGEGWDHVSVSVIRGPGLPGWYDLEYIKRLFFKDDETAVQFHVPPSDHVDRAEVLHLWRWQGGEFPRPPAILIG